MARLGFLGTGAISTALIEGLQHVHGSEHAVLLSPRSEARSTELAGRYSNVKRAADNAAVVDGSDIVFLGFRPQEFNEGLKKLSFRLDQIVVSLLAGVLQATIEAKVAPAVVCRVLPMPPIRLRRGPIVVFPGTPAVAALLAGLGECITVERESDLLTLTHASAVMSSFFQMQTAVADWAGSRGVSETVARFYVASLFDGLSAVSLDGVQRGAALDPAEHETKGGLNALGRAYLNDTGWFAGLQKALDAIEVHKVTKAAPATPVRSTDLA